MILTKRLTANRRAALRLFAPSILAILMPLTVLGQSLTERAVDHWFKKDYASAVTLWTEAANDGDRVSQYNLGWAYEGGLGVIQDLEQSVFWYRSAAFQGDPHAKLKLFDIGSREGLSLVSYGELEKIRDDLSADLKELRQFLDAEILRGKAYAAYLLAYPALSVEREKSNMEQVVERVQAAANKGIVLAQFDLAQWYLRGEGPLAIEQALPLFKSAAGRGYPKAQFELAKIYEIGGYHGQGAREALRWYREAEKNGEVRARARIGGLLRASATTAEEFNEAREWFVKADNAGDNLAKFYIGEMYFLGQGVIKDPSVAFAWVNRMLLIDPQLFEEVKGLAEGGSLFAQLTAARLTLDESSAFYDAIEAFRWFLTAAINGDVSAAREVGKLYLDGKGVDANEEEGLSWLKKASESGDPEAATLLVNFEVARKRREAEARAAAVDEQEVAEKEANEGKTAGPKDRECDPPSVNPDELEPIGSGTGFVINASGDILTNAHVVMIDEESEGDQGEGRSRLCDAVSIRTKDDYYWIQLIAGDKKHDLAALKSCRKFSSHAYLRSADDEVQAGETVYAFGFPNVGSTAPKITNGIVSALMGVRNDVTLLQHTAAVQHGNSGGPLFDKTGLVVGINTLAATRAREDGVVLQNVALSVKANVIQSFLSANDIPFISKRNALPIDAVEIVNQSKAFTVELTCWSVSG